MTHSPVPSHPLCTRPAKPVRSGSAARRRAQPEGEGGALSGAPENRPPTVLVADDDPTVRALLGRVLTRQGLAIITAANGREAIECIRQTPIDVVLLDVAMPRLDGLETLRLIRADDRSATLPVILVTGSDAESDRVRGLESGADDYLAKPFALDELIARVRAQIRGRAAWRRELERARDGRRRLAALIDGLPRDVPLVTLARTLVERLPHALDVDGVALLHFAGGTVRAIAASGALGERFGAAGLVDRREGRGLLVRAASGPWLEDAAGGARGKGRVDIAYVPFRLAPTPRPLGCLAFALEPGAPTAPLSHRLADLIDAVDFIVAVLRPAVEQAETSDAGRSRLRRVISRREFEIHLQPIVRLDTGVKIGVEAFTRFSDGVPPDLRFAEAATLGLSRSIQRATLAAAIRAVSDLGPGIALFVNVSADVLRLEPSLPRIVAARRRPLVIEITEHERIDDYVAVRAALGGLGPDVKLAVDDAGSGYATLKHILALRPAYVKLDMGWVRRIDRDPVRRALVAGLAYFGAETGCELIAEGIETEDELRALRELGITLGQGFLLGRPEPALARQ